MDGDHLHIPYFNMMVAIGLAAGLIAFDCLNRSLRSPSEVRSKADRAVVLALLVVCAAGVGSVIFSNLASGRGALDLPWSFTFYGGVAGGVISCIVLIPAFGLPKSRVLDHLAISMALGHAFGRVGCFLGGCCYGRFFDPPDRWNWISFLDGRVPVQLIEAGCEFCNFGLMLWLWQRRSVPPGGIAALWLVMYASQRFGLEWLRDDWRGSLPIISMIGWSPSQFIAVAAFAGGLIWLWILSSRSSVSVRSS